MTGLDILDGLNLYRDLGIFEGHKVFLSKCLTIALKYLTIVSRYSIMVSKIYDQLFLNKLADPLGIKLLKL